MRSSASSSHILATQANTNSHFSGETLRPFELVATNGSPVTVSNEIRKGVAFGQIIISPAKELILRDTGEPVRIDEELRIAIKEGWVSILKINPIAALRAFTESNNSLVHPQSVTSPASLPFIRSPIALHSRNHLIVPPSAPFNAQSSFSQTESTAYRVNTATPALYPVRIAPYQGPQMSPLSSFSHSPSPSPSPSSQLSQHSSSFNRERASSQQLRAPQHMPVPSEDYASLTAMVTSLSEQVSKNNREISELKAALRQSITSPSPSYFRDASPTSNVSIGSITPRSNTFSTPQFFSLSHSAIASVNASPTNVSDTNEDENQVNQSEVMSLPDLNRNCDNANKRKSQVIDTQETAEINLKKARKNQKKREKYDAAKHQFVDAISGELWDIGNEVLEKAIVDEEVFIYKNQLTTYITIPQGPVLERYNALKEDVKSGLVCYRKSYNYKKIKGNTSSTSSFATNTSVSPASSPSAEELTSSSAAVKLPAIKNNLATSSAKHVLVYAADGEPVTYSDLVLKRAIETRAMRIVQADNLPVLGYLGKGKSPRINALLAQDVKNGSVVTKYDFDRITKDNLKLPAAALTSLYRNQAEEVVLPAFPTQNISYEQNSSSVLSPVMPTQDALEVNAETTVLPFNQSETSSSIFVDTTVVDHNDLASSNSFNTTALNNDEALYPQLPFNDLAIALGFHSSQAAFFNQTPPLHENEVTPTPFSAAGTSSASSFRFSAFK